MPIQYSEAVMVRCAQLRMRGHSYREIKQEITLYGTRCPGSKAIRRFTRAYQTVLVNIARSVSPMLQHAPQLIAMHR